MALVIDNPETERLVEELARRTGRTADVAVAEAVRDKLGRPAANGSQDEDAEIWEDIRKIQDEIAAYPDVDTRTADELIGYDENGLPS